MPYNDGWRNYHSTPLLARNPYYDLYCYKIHEDKLKESNNVYKNDNANNEATELFIMVD